MIRFHALHDLRRYTIPQSMLGPSHTQTQIVRTVYGYQNDTPL